MSLLKGRLARAGAALVLGLGLAVAAATGTSGAATPHYDHNSPEHDWGGYTCADDARVVAQADVRAPSGLLVATAEMAWSPRCRTHWAQVVRHVDMAQFPHHWFSAAIVDSQGGDIYCQYAEPDGFTGGGCYTAMLAGDCTDSTVYAKGLMFYESNDRVVAYGRTDNNAMVASHCDLTRSPGYRLGK